MPAQTLSEIRTLLAQAGLRPQHRFGQNFLVDLNLMRKIVAAAELAPGDVVLEVGPGTGSLTGLLLDSGCRVVAVEIDRGLQELLTRQFGAEPRFTLVAGDALAGKHAVNPAVWEALGRPPAGATKMVANLPYQIATPLIVDLLIAAQAASPAGRRLERLVVTIQKEVAERLAAAAGADAYGPVSVIVQSLARVEPLATLPPQAFWPAPKVESAAILIRPLPREAVELDDPAGFAKWMQRWFAMRRKKLRTIARKLDEAAAGVEVDAWLTAAGVNPDGRPEELSPAQWRSLARAATAAGAWRSRCE